MQPSPLLDWRDAPAVVVLASGPSLNACDIDQVRRAGVRTIAVNRSFDLAPDADVVYMGDLRAVMEYGRRVRPGRLWSCTELAAQQHGARWVRAVNGEALSRDWINTYGNSGLQAVNLAYLFGARKIIMLGFDMRRGPQGEKHWHADHPRPLVQTQPFDEWIHRGEGLAFALERDCVDAVDCTPGGALEGFRKGHLGEELASCRVLTS